MPTPPSSSSGNPASKGTDDPIYLGLRAGEPDATETVRGWIAKIVRYRNWRFPDPEGVEQDILLRVFELVQAGKFQGGSAFKTFVHSVTTHACIDTYRKEKRRGSREIGKDEEGMDRLPGSADPEASAGERTRWMQLRYVYQKLPEDCRKLWALIYGEALPVAVVAERLKITVNNARVRAHRCLQKARAIASGMQGS